MGGGIALVGRVEKEGVRGQRDADQKIARTLDGRVKEEVRTTEKTTRAETQRDFGQKRAPAGGQKAGGRTQAEID